MPPPADTASCAAVANPLLPLQVQGLRLELGGQPVLRGLDFTLAGDGISVMLGPNGAGKSVLQRVLLGLRSADAGRVDWNGRSPQQAASALGLVLQKPVMLRRSVRANIAFALARAGVPRRERPAAIATALAQGGLTALADRPAPKLSGGEVQRLAIVRAWVQRPRVLFLDEPCASLDPRSTLRVEQLIGEICAAGTRVVLTTHDLGQARRLAHEVLFLADGRLCEQRPATDFFERPASAEAAAYLEGRLPV
jgi:tungstate transport system ATP-binding protein